MIKQDGLVVGTDRVLFIRLRLMGDIVFTIPAIQIYKSRYPRRKIFYVVEEKFREIAELIPGIHEVITVPYKMGFRELLKFRKKVREIGFDYVVDFHSGPKSAILTFISGIKVRVGYRTMNRNWAYNRLSPRNFTDGPTHSVFNQAKLFEKLDIPIDKPPFYPDIIIEENKIRSELKEKLGSEDKIVIHIGAGNDFRDWGIGNFASLSKRLIDAGYKVLLIGHNLKEQESGAYMARKYPVVNLTGKLNVLETLYIIKKAKLFFGADSGPVHLASLTHTPILALYGPNLPEISGPWRQEDVWIKQKKLDCRPCAQRKCLFGDLRCMKDVSEEEVFRSIISIIVEKKGDKQKEI